MDDDTPMGYGSLRYQLNAAPWFADCDAKGTVCFQNNRGNRHFVRISYQLDSGEKVYQSEMIPPDSHIHRAGLDQQLSRGEYGGVCRIELFDMVRWNQLESWRKTSPLPFSGKKLAEYILIWYNNKITGACKTAG